MGARIFGKVRRVINVENGGSIPPLSHIIMSKLSTMIRDGDSPTTQPKIGQRVLVWDFRLSTWTIAYYTGRGRFEEWQRGNGHIVVNGRWWAPLPEEPEE